MEEWKDILGFEGLYQVSSFDRIKSLPKIGSGGHLNCIILKPNTIKDGYLAVSLYKDKKKYSKKVHQLVAIAFVPNPNSYSQINHKDEDKTNNHVNNLEWCDSSYNNNYGKQSRLNRISRGAIRGRKVQQLSLDGTLLKEWDSIRGIERELGFKNSNIIRCCKGIASEAYNFKWRYKTQ